MEVLSTWIPGFGRSAGERIGYPLQDSWASLVAQLVKDSPALRETWVQKIPWRRERQPSPVFWPGEFHELYSPWSSKQRVGHDFQVSDFHFHFRGMSPSSPAMVLGGEGRGGGTKRPASGSHGLSVHFTYAHSVPTEDTRLGPHAAPPTRHLGHSCISSQMGPVLLQQLLGDNGGDLPPPFKVLMHTPPCPAEPWGSPLGQGSTPKGLQLAWWRVKSTSLPQSLLAGL